MKNDSLAEEPEYAALAQERVTEHRNTLEWRQPAAGKHQRGQCGYQDHVGVFGQEKYGKTRTRVLDVETGYDL